MDGQSSVKCEEDLKQTIQFMEARIEDASYGVLRWLFLGSSGND